MKPVPVSANISCNKDKSMNQSLKAMLCISMAAAVFSCSDFQENTAQHYDDVTDIHEPAVNQGLATTKLVQVYDYVNEFTGKGLIATEWLRRETEEASSPAVWIRYIVSWDEENTDPIVAFGIQVQYRMHGVNLQGGPPFPKVVELRVLADNQRGQTSPGETVRASNEQYDRRLITTFWFPNETHQLLLRYDSARMQFLVDGMPFTFALDEGIQESLKFMSNYVVSNRQL